MLSVGSDGRESLKSSHMCLEVPQGTIAKISSILRTKAAVVKCSVSIGNFVIVFDAIVEKQLKGTEVIEFKNIVQSNKDEIVAKVGLSEDSAITKFIHTPPTDRKLIIGVPTKESFNELSKILSKLLPTSEFSGTPVPGSSKVVILLAEDLVDVVMKYRLITENDLLAHVGILKTNCTHCTRSAQPDIGLITKLPQELQNANFAHYQIGRGCDKCNHSGGSAPRWIDVSTTVSKSLVEMTKGRFVEALLAEEIAATGGITLLERIFSKVVTGEVSLESMFNTLGNSMQRISPLFGLNKGRKKEPVSVSKRNKKILVLEDDIDQAEILSLILQEASYEVEIANDGLAGLSAITERKFDLVISDLMMPKMDGVQFVANVRKQKNTVPILILTVLGDEERECALLDLGADDYCAKSIQKKTLLKRVEALLRRV